jgi:EAL domain-containing protein (putative c-di-GMP-specific phosphodiesterase class I)
VKPPKTACGCPAPNGSMRVATVSETPAGTRRLADALRNAGIQDVVSLDSPDSLARHLSGSTVDVVVGEISSDSCAALGVPNVLKEARSNGGESYRPHLLWLDSSAIGSCSERLDPILTPASTRRVRSPSFGGVPLAMLRLHAKLLRMTGVHVSLMHDDGRKCLSDALRALDKSRRIRIDAPVLQPCERPTDEEVVAALATGEGLRVVFQPQYQLSTRKIVGAEALIRWHHSRCGEVPADLIVAFAERLGLNLLLFSFVSAKGIEMLLRLRATAADLPIAVNASASTLCTPGLADRLAHRMQLANLSPGALKIELTEKIEISDLADLGNSISEIQAKGLVVSLDDFGSGGSTPLVFARANFDELKIDGSVVRSACGSAASRATFREIAAMAHARGVRLIAEGIEDQEAAEAVQEMGCDIGQGYFFSHPLEAEEFFAQAAAVLKSKRAPANQKPRKNPAAAGSPSYSKNL